MTTTLPRVGEAWFDGRITASVTDLVFKGDLIIVVWTDETGRHGRLPVDDFTARFKRVA